MGNCVKCGKEVTDGMSLCAECEATAVPVMAPLATAESVVEDPQTKVAGLGSFFGLILLFSVPVVGFISAIVMAFAPKNKNIKNFARAALIWLVIGALLLGLVIGAAIAAINVAVGAIGGMVGKDFQDIGDLIDYASGVYSEVGGTLDQLSEIGLTPDKIVAYAGLLEDIRAAEITPEKFGHLWKQYQNSTLTADQLEQYGDLLEKAEDAGITPEQFEEFADEIGDEVDLGALADRYGDDVAALIPNP